MSESACLVSRLEHCTFRDYYQLFRTQDHDTLHSVLDRIVDKATIEYEEISIQTLLSLIIIFNNNIGDPVCARGSGWQQREGATAAEMHSLRLRTGSRELVTTHNPTGIQFRDI